MNSEEFERKKEFIVEQRAQFAAGIQKMRERLAESENVVDRLEIYLTEARKQTDEKIEKLMSIVDRQRRPR